MQKSTKKIIQNWILMWIVFLATVLWWVVLASSLKAEDNNNTLTSGMWNELVDRVQHIENNKNTDITILYPDNN